MKESDKLNEAWVGLKIDLIPCLATGVLSPFYNICLLLTESAAGTLRPSQLGCCWLERPHNAVWVISQLLGLGCPTEPHPLQPQRLNLRGFGSILKRSHGTCGPDLQPTAACVSAGIMRLNINSRASAQFSLMELTWMSVHGVHVLPLTCCARLYEAD